MKKLKPCGTQAAYSRHRRHGEKACDACREAHRLYQNARNKARAANSALADRAGHGKASTYCNYACRCEPCRKAAKLKMHGYRYGVVR